MYVYCFASSCDSYYSLIYYTIEEKLSSSVASHIFVSMNIDVSGFNQQLKSFHTKLRKTMLKLKIRYISAPFLVFVN